MRMAAALVAAASLTITLHKWITIPVVTPILCGIYIVALVMGILLWLSVFDLVVPLGQALYVLGLIVLLAFAAAEFLYFIGLMSHEDRGQ